ncbi:D-alanine--D-alanine ligase family protein [Thermodesulforhabdus norvegica]|uniref:D-alanine--D-alanine ligase n=1 Tax=Thermodesulforhabdus norvegica TaxID=39841 RepID=A0A1I4UDT3_9BACT|nr:D-alanine--D-alanine ligase [Thermodesulforhabdus norvegica]SFM86903.1 D-alanine--D-alanine ligase [Thermodesulforhabdus norvegica]
MRIGITYDLKSEYILDGWTEEEAAEFDSEETVQAIEESLIGLGYEVERIGRISNLVEHLSRGNRWDLVFNIAEGAYGPGREAQIPGILEAYRIPYTFSDPVTLCLTLHKGYAKQIMLAKGIPTADFFILTDLDDLNSCNLNFPVFVKPIAEGTGKGISDRSVVKGMEELKEVCSFLLDFYKQPLLVESYLSGREFTVGIVGTGKRAHAIGVMEISFSKPEEAQVYSYEVKKRYQEFVIYRLVSDPEAMAALDLALEAWRALGCRDAGRVDIRSDEKGHPYFLEVNPLAGLHPIHSDLPILCRLAGIGYVDLIGMIVQEALRRYERKNVP